MCVCVCVCVVIQWCLTRDPVDCSLAVHGILQARILEWVAISFSRVSSPPPPPRHTHIHTHIYVKKLKINFPKKAKYTVNQLILFS